MPDFQSTRLSSLFSIGRFQGRKQGLIFAVCAMLPLVTGCSTSFKYTPRHDQTYAPIANRKGLAIQTGQDLRPGEEIRPAWATQAEVIIARALADEVKSGKLFHRVRIHADSLNPKKYSEIVQFQVMKFECYNQATFMEAAGRDILELQGIRGALIAESIPVKYDVEVEIKFEVMDGVTRQSVFEKTYAVSRTVNVNGYQGEKPKIQQTSAALEGVVTQFIADLTTLPLSQQAPQGVFSK